MKKAVESYNEWDPLEEVIVGNVTGAMYPEVSPILAANGEPEWLLHYQEVQLLLLNRWMEEQHGQISQ